MSTSARAGAGALIIGALLGFIGYAVLPTLSDDAADVVPALTNHRSGMITGLTLQTFGIALLIGGLVWLAITLAPSAPRLATVGGVTGVAGALVVLFEDGLSAASPSLVGGLHGAQATSAVHHVNTSIVAGLDPVSVLFAIGIALLAFASVKAGAPRWVGPVLTAGVLVQTVGFAAAVRPLVLVGFAALAVVFAVIVRSLHTTEVPQPARRPAMAG